jgi:hypothetical protein
MLLVVYFITAGGIPLPAGSSLPVSGELYPCAGHACGCASAEQCWRRCCCHSLAERIAWAREHKVRPPAFVIAEARQGGIDVAWLQSKTASGSAGGSDGESAKQCKTSGKTPAQPGAVGVLIAKPTRSCCVERHSHSAVASKANSNSKHSTRVIGWRALECQGNSSDWLAAVPTLIVRKCAAFHHRPVVSWLVPAASERADCVAELPAVPPPEAA